MTGTTVRCARRPVQSRAAGSSGYPRRLRRRAFLLIVVLVVVSLLTLSTLTFTEMMIARRESVDLIERRDQAMALAESGVAVVNWFLLQDEAMRNESGGVYNNPDLFQAQPVLLGQSPTHGGNFTIVAPAFDESGQFAGQRYGLQDESARLNLNAVLLADSVVENGARTLLMGLPGMTEEVADAILDWIDPDDEPREFGAESDYYEQLTPPYAAKNGPLATIGELLLVRGVTPQLLYGLDTNRNGMVDSHELAQPTGIASTDPSASGASTGVDGDPNSAIGWAAYLTLYSQEANQNREGFGRIYLNQEDMEQLHQELSEVLPADWVTFIVAYRQNGPYTGNEPGELNVSAELDLSRPGETPLTQVLELIGAKVQIEIDGNEQVIASPFVEDPAAMALYLPTLMDNVTVNPSVTIPGRININQAPRTILLGIPGMTEEIVDQIIQERIADPAEAGEDPNRRHETWILVEGIVTLEEMKLLAPLICAGGSVFRAQIVGYFEDGSAAARVEVVFDTMNSQPMLCWKDLTHLGRGYPLDVLGVQWSAAAPAP